MDRRHPFIPARLASRPARLLAVALAAAVCGPLLAVPPAGATPASPQHLTGQQVEISRTGAEVAPGTAPALTGPAADLPDPVWPGAGAVTATVPATGASTVSAAGLPVSVARADSDLPASVAVEVLDRASVPETLRDGVVLRVGGTRSTAAGEATVAVDYSSFKYAYGGDWASRLRLWTLPECALTTPERAGCSAVPLDSDNDPATGTVTARAEVQPVGAAQAANSRAELAGNVSTARTTGTLLMVAAAAAGSSGDFGATSLAATSTWSAGGNSGGFSWSYAMGAPPAHAGPAPKLQVGYSSSSVDGRTSASNNQPSWLGEGFDLETGFIERQYIGCNADTENGANNPESLRTGDQCWRSDNATISFQGSSTELIYQEGKGWHGRSEAGWIIKRLNNGTNGDNNGEYWELTATDGTRYYFGYNNPPGQSTATNSVYTVPVYGNHDGEECHQATFAASSCDQAWRWNLDYIVDPRGNTSSYWYEQEKNQYATRATSTENVDYVRGGTLSRIDYGTWDRGAADRSVKPVAQVLFATADRCLSDCGTHNGERWPDVPWDSECKLDADSCGTNYSPTFWSTKRLASITTQVWDTTVSPAKYQPVTSWTFAHSFPNPHDGTNAGLWLDSIVKTGLVGEPITMPPITFTPTPMPNRVLTDVNQTNSWQRLKRLTTETGAFTDIEYTLPECKTGNLPATPQSNTKLCYPVIGPDPLNPDGPDITEWWHKYLVTKVIENDTPLADYRSPSMVTSYTYVGTPYWAYADDNGFTKPKRRTWSQFRGYETVDTRVGSGAATTLSRTTYLRGVEGKVVKASLGEDVTDQKAFAGMVRESVTYNGTEAKPLSKTVNVPWQSEPTASRTINNDTVHARYTGTRVVHTGEAVGTNWRVGRVESTIEGTYGSITQVQDDGDTSVTGDETCTVNTYNRNTVKHIVALPKQITKTALACGKTPASADDIVSDTRTYYDGASSADTVPAYGTVTKTEVLAGWTAAGGTQWQTSGTIGTLDAFGRALSVTDSRGNAITTVFTPASGGPTTAEKSTNVLGWSTTTEKSPYWGVTTKSTDANGRVATIKYDALGRVSKVWEVGWAEADADKKDKPSTRYTYSFASGRNAYPHTKTETLNARGNYLASYEILDGFLRARQIQTTTTTGPDRVVADTNYDEWGRVSTVYGSHAELGAPSGVLWGEPQWSVPAVTRTVYDLAGRGTDTIFLAGEGETNQVEKWRSTIVYGGDRKIVTPPRGDVPTTSINDFRGRVIEVRQHTTDAGVSGDYQATKYAYDRKGHLTKVTDPAGNEWTYGYDIKGRQISADDPDRGPSTTEFDVHDQVIRTTDARGEVLAYSYDTLGRKTGLYDDSTSGNKRAEWVYDRLASTGAPQVRGMLTQSIRYDNGNAYRTQVSNFTTRYQPAGVAYVIPASEGALAGSYSFGYSYAGADGSPTAVTYPAAGSLSTEQVTTVYDAVNGLPAGLTTNIELTGGSYVTLQEYTALGEPTLTRRKTASGVYVESTNSYYEDGTRRFQGSKILTETGTGTVSDSTYVWDPAGNIASIADKGDTQCFGYDKLRRLTSAWTPKTGVACGTAPSTANLGGPAPYWTDWTFDAIGNRKTETNHTATGDATTTYTIPPSGADSVRPHAVTGSSTVTSGVAAPTTRSYGYDQAGNTTSRPGVAGTQTVTWDAENRAYTTIEGNTTTSYVYDSDGTRLIRRDGIGRTLYLPGMEVRLNPDNTKAATRYYSFGGQPVASRTTDDISGLTWLFSDHQGTQSISIAAGTQAVTVRRQNPYGGTRGAAVAWPNSKGFVGGDIDPTGLTHIGAREYDTALGRFISVDPIMDLTDPQQWNGYAYAHNNPISFSDPTGLRDCDYADCGSGGESKGDRDGDGATDGAALGHGKPGGGRLVNNGARYTPVGTNARDRTPTVVEWIESWNCEMWNPGIYNRCHISVREPEEIIEAAASWFCEYRNECEIHDQIRHEYFLEGAEILSWIPVAGIPFSYALAKDAFKKGEYFGAGIEIVGMIPVGKAAKALKVVDWLRGIGKGTEAADDAADVAGASCRAFNSFSADTSVLMADGSTKPISEIRVGDLVHAEDPLTGEVGAHRVTGVWAHEDDLVDLRLTEGTVTTTTDHPFWSESDRGWRLAAELPQGDRLRVAGGGTAEVVGTAGTLRRTATAYNLTVDHLHTYFVLVGTKPVLVHNCGDQHVALGLEDEVKGFADDVGAEHFMRDTDWKASVWTAANLLKYDYPGVRVSFTLDGMHGVENGVEAAVGQSLSRNARQIGGATDLELAFFNDAGTLGKVDFYIGGVKQENPFK
ncbi:RHS repeat-associated protein [Catenuloplanes nepalensis]|uniref:RHS repeat-associated protein n=1 Tax=Catenuloplanes nepalensis TaxID=587533 RepID=A0ABT9MPM5_9ACTN|nr:RHS repeat-associated core domain-containing protein [Catenuloplanes nepalensis]MDP9793375.1 RHS repeat-associated protein [Catenuloplanes nepalensis]